ncbi:MAG: acetyl-CoA carboxylase biotin carboxyl carrier protein [Myxococcaceae bacterium]|nr:acetyl-CoA carboxylase biotin carboxyl carrier protein [Myxococcaceae bacterium]
MARQHKSAEPVRGAAHTEVEGTTLDVDALQKIVEILEASEVTRLVWRKGEERLYIRRSPPRPQVALAQQPLSVPQVSVTVPAPQVTTVPAPAVEAAPAAAAQKPGHLVTSPFVGTFYRAPAPDQPPFVEVGSLVKKGQPLCIIEAMKLMNEIESEVEGRVAEILVENGQPVEFGQALFRIEQA